MSDVKIDDLLATISALETERDSILGIYELATEHYNEMVPRAEERGARWAIEAVVALLAKGGSASVMGLDPAEVCREARKREELEL